MFLVTIAKVAEFDQSMGTFESTGPRSAESNGVQSPQGRPTPMSRPGVGFFDWEIEDYETCAVLEDVRLMSARCCGRAGSGARPRGARRSDGLAYHSGRLVSPIGRRRQAEG